MTDVENDEDPFVWLRANGHDLGPVSGQDRRALRVVAYAWELYAMGDSDATRAALDVMPFLLGAMQRKCWPLARELIARAMDWDDRDRIWPKVLAAAERLGLR
jgi:hypothetical protein